MFAKIRTLDRRTGGLRSLVTALALVLGASAALRAADTLAPGQPFPALSGFQLEGTLPDTSKARVVIVDFWASWCAPCKASFPIYDGLQREFGDKGVLIIAVNVDQTAQKMEAFLKKQPVSFAVVRDAGTKLVQQVSVPTMPTSFVIDSKGVIRFVHVGFHGEETRKLYVEQINTLLGEKS